MFNRKTFMVRINAKGSDSAMWYSGKLGEEFIVEISTCASTWDSNYIASGWVYFREVESRNAIELADCEIIEQFPNLVKMSSRSGEDTKEKTA